MAHTVSGLIRKAPHIQAGQNNNGNYTMFCFELAEFNKGTQGKEDSYTNYSVALFAKSQGAIDFHGKAIAEGSFVVVVNCDKLMVEKQTSKQDGREFIKLKMMNASLGDFNNPNQQQQAPQQQAYQQQAPAQYQQGQGFQQQQPPQQQGCYQNQPGK